jgi:hypothetical protein
MRRGERRARETAARTRTPLVTYRDGKIEKRIVPRFGIQTSDAGSPPHAMTTVRHGMSICVTTESRIARVEVNGETITAHLTDGRAISVPLAWSWRLSDATPAQRANWKLIGDGQGVHWPDIDEDLSAEGMLRGTPAVRSPRRAAKRESAAPARKHTQSVQSRRRSR